MLPKSARLKKNDAFQTVFRKGRPFFFQDIGCRIMSGQEKTLVGFSVSKKMYPRAVDRNRVRRILSESVRKRRADIPKGAFIVFFLARKLDTADFGVFDREVGMIFKNMR